MSYLNPRRSPEREQLQLFVNNVKQEIDTFWSNILNEFNSFSNDITSKLGKIEKDYNEYRQKYEITDDAYNNHGRRSSLEYPQKHTIAHALTNKREANDIKDLNDKTDKKERGYLEQKEEYKKYAKTGHNISVGHGRTLSTMEIPSSFKLDAIEESILIIKPRAATTHCKDIYTTLLDENFYVTDFEEGRASAPYFEKLWAKKYGYLSYFHELCQEMSIDTFLVLKVFRVNAINDLIDLCGHDDPQKAYNDNPNTLRAMFGQNVIQNAVYPSKNQKEVDQFNKDFFNNSNNDDNNESQQQSLVVIKPNAAKQFGDNIRAHLIGQKFTIVQQKVFNLNSFVYSNMRYDAPPQYTQGIVDYMASGAVIALIVQKCNVYQELARVIGDRDPEIAAQLQPESIRAHYGVSIVKNAVEYALNYEIYKANIPTFFFDVNIMNQVIDMEAIEQIKTGNESDNDSIHSGSNQSIQDIDDSRFAIVVIKPHVSSFQIEAIQDVFADHDIRVNKQKSLNMPYESIKEMLRIEYRNNEVIQLMANHLASNEILVWLVSSKTNKNIYNTLRKIVPEIREQYGIDEIRDVMHFSTTAKNFKAISHEFFFEFAGATPPKTPNINLKLKSLDQMNKDIEDKHQRRGTEVKPFISQFSKEQKSIMLIKPHITKNQLFQIRKMLHDASIEVIQEKQMSLPIDILYSAFEMDGYEEDEYHSMCQYIASDEFIVWMLQRENVYEQLRYVVGPEHPIEAKAKYPQSIRAYYGLDNIRNAVYFAPNEHIYNHQVGIFFFHDDNERDGTEIPNVPSEAGPRGTGNKFDYINDKLLQLQSTNNASSSNHTNHNDVDHVDDALIDVAVGDDEYALLLLSSMITSNAQILEQIKSRITANKFIVMDQLSRFFPHNIVSEMFNDGLSSFSCDGPPIPKIQFDELLDTFNNGEIMALHVCRQNAFVLLDRLRKELEKHNLITSIYITLSIADYKSKCMHFFESAESDHDDNVDKGHVAKSVRSQLSRLTEESLDNNERAIIIFKPHVTDEQKTEIRRMLLHEMLHVFDETSTYIPRKTLRDLLSHEGYDEYYMDQLCEHMAGASVQVWLLKGENVYKDLMLIVGPQDSDVARVQAPNSIRARFGLDRIQNVLYFTKNKQIFEETHRYFFFDEPLSQHTTSQHTVSQHDANQDPTANSRHKMPLQQQLDEFELKSKSALSLSRLSANMPPPLNESDEEQRAVVILQHHLKPDELHSIRIMFDNQDIELIQEKECYLPSDTFRTIFEVSQPNWSRDKIEKACEYYTKGQCVALLLGKSNIYRLLHRVIGNENPLIASHGTVRQLFGIDEIQNACFFTQNERAYKTIADEIFFDHQTISESHKTSKSKGKPLYKTKSYTATASAVSSAASDDRSFRSNEQQKSILVFKPHMKSEEIEKIEAMLYGAGLNIVNQKTTYLPADVWYLCMKDEVADDAHLALEAQHLSSGAITAYLVIGDDACDTLADLAGPTEPSVAKMHMPQSIRALFGIDEIRNCVWWSKNRKVYKRILHKFFFSEYRSNSQSNTQPNSNYNKSVHSNKYTAVKYRPDRTETASVSSSIRGTDKTLLLIKPHVLKTDRKHIKQRLRDHDITIIQEKETHLAKESCRYLLKAEGYDEEYTAILVDELNKGELCALLISKEGIFSTLAEIVGPSDPIVARKTSPDSIRAKYGKDIVRNAVYYTKSKHHYKKVFSFFFFEDVSEKKLEEVNEADNSNSALLHADGRYMMPGAAATDDYTDNETVSAMSATSYGFHSHKLYAQVAPCAVLIIKPHAMEHQSHIVRILESHDIVILSKRVAAIHAEAIYGFLKDNQAFQSLNEQIMNLIVQDMCNGNVCVYCLGDRTNQTFHRVELGLQRVQEIGKIISNKYGLDQIRNAIYVSRNVDEMRKQRKFFFLDSVFFKHESIDDSYQYSLMIIKPNAFQYRTKIIQVLKNKEFHVIVNKRMNNPMELSVAQEFFHPYYGADADFDGFCESMGNGEWAVIMVSRVGNCINALRQFTEQIQTMYADDDRSIASLAVYTSSTEPEFWRDRAFFFFNENNVQFVDYGSVTSFKRQKSRKKIATATTAASESRSVYSEMSAYTNITEMSASFGLNPIEESILLIKPHAIKYKRDIERILLDRGFFIAKSRPMNMPTMVWADFYRQYKNRTWFHDLCEAMAEDQIISYVLYRVNCISFLRKLVGPTDPNIARQKAPKCLRAIYGESIIRNGFHCSHNADGVLKERSELFFEDVDTMWGASTNKRNQDRVFVIIKPEAAKTYGDNIRTHLVANGFEIVKEKVVHLSETIYMSLSLDVSAEHFKETISYLASDQIIVMVLEKANGFQDIVDIIGHRDPNYALQQQPDSIRAIYGENIVQNAIDASFNKEMYDANYDVFFDDEEANISDTKSYRMVQDKRRHEHEKRIELKRQNKKEKCLLIIKPHIKQSHIDYIKQMLIQLEFEIMSERMINIPYHAFVDAFQDDEDPNTFDAVCREWSSAEITIFVLSKLNAFQTLKTLVGPDDPDIARSEAPQSIRAKFGQDRIRNCCWYSMNQHQYDLKLQHFDY